MSGKDYFIINLGDIINNFLLRIRVFDMTKHGNCINQLEIKLFR